MPYPDGDWRNHPETAGGIACYCCGKHEPPKELRYCTQCGRPTCFVCLDTTDRVGPTSSAKCLACRAVAAAYYKENEA